ncbi:hypothetical protein, partial [Kocuria rhizophila]|uniref:hypothetical protein n=1 Tax=Kocuria rhizophila TaxID=72000 RepID=UPI001C92E1BB
DGDGGAGVVEGVVGGERGERIDVMVGVEEVGEWVGVGVDVGGCEGGGGGVGVDGGGEMMGGERGEGEGEVVGVRGGDDGRRVGES